LLEYGVVLLREIDERLGLCFGSWSSAIWWTGATRRITHPFVEPQRTGVLAAVNEAPGSRAPSHDSGSFHGPTSNSTKLLVT
jgi:hypothetical protein